MVPWLFYAAGVFCYYRAWKTQSAGYGFVGMACFLAGGVIHVGPNGTL